MKKRAFALLCCMALLLSSDRAHGFCIAWMSDTQNYTGSRSYVYRAMTQWITDNREDFDIRYVFHTGDIVGASKSDAQWQQAGEAMRLLSDEGVPFLAVTGNHDTGSKVSYSRYMDYVGNLRPTDMYSEYADTGSRYALFSADGRDYIFLGIAFSKHGPSEEEAQWARDVLNRYSDRIAIILTHSYLKKSADYTTQGRVIFEQIVKPCKNVFMVLCGHCRDISSRAEELDDDGDGTADRTVYAILSNFQTSYREGGGFMRLLTFRNEDIYICTFSPVTGLYNNYSRGKGLCTATVPLPPAKDTLE